MIKSNVDMYNRCHASGTRTSLFTLLSAHFFASNVSLIQHKFSFKVFNFIFILARRFNADFHMDSENMADKRILWLPQVTFNSDTSTKNIFKT